MKNRPMHRPAVSMRILDKSTRIPNEGLRVTGVVVARGPVPAVRLPADNDESLRMAKEAFGEPQTKPKTETDDLLLATLYAFNALTEKKNETD